MKPSSLSLEAKTTKEEKGARQKPQKAFKLRCPDQCTVVPRSTATLRTVARSCQPTWPDRAAWHRVVVPHFWPRRPDSPWVYGRALLAHARSLPCFAIFCCSWCSGLPRTSIVLMNNPECYLFHQNPKVLPKSTDIP